MGVVPAKKLQELENEHPCVGLVQSVGLLGGFEVVHNKKTKKPFIEEDRFATFAGDISRYPEVMISERCFLHGLMVGSNVPNAIRVAPPLTIREEEMELGLAVLHKILAEIDELCAG